MASNRETITQPGGLTAESVASKEFTSSRRGYDQAEVRQFLALVAHELSQLQTRTDRLTAALDAAEEQASNPTLSEEVVVTALGQEFANSLRSAHAAAADMRARAGEEAERILEQARQQAKALTTEADQRLAAAAEAATATTTAAREAAQREAEQILAKAHADADIVRQQAEQEQRLTIEGAQAIRERILADLSRRRRVATVQIEQLRAGRERLLESYGVVRRTLEEVNDELQRADAEARAAAEEAGRRLEAEGVDKDEATVAHPGVEAATAPVGAALLPPPPVDPPTVAMPPVEHQAGEEPAPGTVPARERPAPVDEPTVAVPPVEATPPAGGGAGRRRGGRSVRVVRVGSDDDLPPPAPASSGRGAPQAVTAATPQAVTAAQPAADAEEPPVEEPPAEAQPPGGLTLVEPGPGLAEDDPALEEEPSATSDADESLLQHRDEELGQLESGLGRGLKRALQDEHNGILDRLRSLRANAPLGSILPDEAAQAATYSATVQPYVQDAALAGARFAAERLGGGVVDAEAARQAVGHVVTEATERLVKPLRQRVEGAIAELGDDPVDELVDVLGSIYRETRSQRVEPLVVDLLTTTFSEGTWRAVPSGTGLRWVTEDADGPCPDCDDNGLAGAVPKGEVYPTGQVFPPAHDGCRCLLVPEPG